MRSNHEVSLTGRFKQLFSSIPRLENIDIFRELNDILTDDASYMLKKFAIHSIDGRLRQFNFISYAIYSYNTELLKHLACYAKKYHYWEKFTETLAKYSDSLNLDNYYTLCDIIAKKAQTGWINSKDLASLHEMRQRLPVQLHVDNMAELSMNIRSDVSDALLSEVQVLRDLVELKRKELAAYKQQIADSHAFTKASESCKPYREDAPVANDNNRLSEAECLALCTEDTRSYINARKAENKSLAQQYEELNPSDDEIETYMRNIKQYEDAFYMEIFSIPVLFKGKVFDWRTIMEKFERRGNKFVPFAPLDSFDFELKELVDGRFVVQMIEGMLDQVRAARARKAKKEMDKTMEKIANSDKPEAFLIEACQQGDLALLNAYLEKFKSQPDRVNLAKDANGHAAIVVAVRCGKKDVLQALMNFPGIDLSHRFMGMNLLMTATTAGSKDCYDLLKNKFAVNERSDGKLYTVLMYAILAANTSEIVADLLSNLPALDLSLTNREGQTVMDLLPLCTNPDIHFQFDQVLKKHIHAALTSSPVNEAFLEICIRFYGEKLIIPNNKLGANEPMLFAFIQHAPTQLTKKVIEIFKHKDALNQVYEGYTLMHYAVMYADANVVSALIQAGCLHVNTKDENFGRTPLILAAKAKKTEIMSVLIHEGKAQLDARNNKGRDALFYVTERMTVLVPKDQAAAEILVKANPALTLQQVSMFAITKAPEVKAATPSQGLK